MAQIVRSDPFKNLSTDTPINILTRPISRSDLHRILKAHGIEHPVGANKQDLLTICAMYEIDLTPVSPGRIEPKEPPKKKEDKEENVVEIQKPKEYKMAEDGWPILVPVLKKYCKERGIPFKANPTRKELVASLEEYMKNPGAY